MVDSLSSGRLILGVGSGYQPYEFDRFGADLAQAREMLEEFLDLLDLAFTRTTFTYTGKHYSMPETHISARPVNGTPEIWLAGDNEAGHRLAARRGLVPMFTARWKGADYIAEMRSRIEESWKAEGKDPGTMPLGIQRFLCVTESREEALAYVDNAPPPDAARLGAAPARRGHGRRHDDRNPVPGRTAPRGNGRQSVGR